MSVDLVYLTPEAHRIYFEKNPKIAAKCAAVRASHDNTPAVASGSGVASSAVPSTQVPQPQPYREITDVQNQKMKHKLNQRQASKQLLTRRSCA